MIMKKILYYDRLSGIISIILCLLIPFVSNAASYKENKNKKPIPKKIKLKDVSNAKAVVEAFKVVVRKHAVKDMDVLAEEIMSQHKKNPEVATGIANAFFYNSGVTDSAHTMKYAEWAMKIDKTYAPAYLVAGELMERRYRDTLKAAEWYEKGVAANPKHPDCYLSYAKMMSTKDITLSENMFNKLRAALPDYPAYLGMSKIYERLADNNINTGVNLANAVDFLEKEKPENLSQYDWDRWATMGMFKGKDYSLDICQKGLSYFPKYYGLNRSAANFAYDLQKWDVSQKYFEDLMYNSDTLVVRPVDVFRYAKCFKERKNYTKANEWMKKHMDIDSIAEHDRQTSLQQLGECYIEMGEYDMAEKTFNEHLNYCRVNKQSTLYGLNQLVQLYTAQSEESVGDEKLIYFAKMDSVYVIWATENPDFAEIAYLRRWALNLESRLNHPDVCVQTLEQIVVIDKAKGDANRVKSNMPTVFGFLGRAYFLGEGVKKNLIKADEYCNKCLELEPTNESALNLRKFIDKSLPKSKRRR